MNYKRYIQICTTLLILGLFSMMLGGCKVNFGDTNVDPNNPSEEGKQSTYLMLRAMQGVTFAYFSTRPAPNVNTYDPFSQIYPQYIAEAKNVQYTTFQTEAFDMWWYYDIFLKNLQAIEQMANDKELSQSGLFTAMGSKNNQLAVAKTLKAYYYMHLADILGMIYFEEALQGDEGNVTPKFNTVEEVYTALDKELNEAYQLFNPREPLNRQFDIIYQGNVEHWKKLNASLRMMMAIKLADVAPADGKARFAKAYADGAIEDNSANMCYQYLLENDNRHPMYDNEYMGSQRKDFYPSKTLVDEFIKRKDPRMFTYAQPNSDGEMLAVPFGTDRTKITEYTGKVCRFAEPLYAKDARISLVSASRILLLEAEAAVRGWITAEPQDLLTKGIRASFQNKGVAKMLASYKADEEKSKVYQSLKKKLGFAETIEEYLQLPQNNIAQLTPEKQIEEIAMQRWMNGFMENGIEAWSDWRRLNVPKLDQGDASRSSIGHIPYRRTYSGGDYETNLDNYQQVLKTQGENSMSTRIWWDVADNH